MKHFRRQSGQVFVLVALSVTTILAFVGLATDVGMRWSSRRKLQTAADVAAVAGTNALLTSNSSAYAQAATDVAALNGFTNGQNNTTVTVTEPNPGGSYPYGTYVQVNITQSVPTYFLNVLGYHSIKVTNSALAGNTSSPNTVMALNGSGNRDSAISGFAYVSNHRWGRTSLFDDRGSALFDNGDSWDGGIIYVDGSGGHGGSSSSNSYSLAIGPNASGCHVTCNSSSYTFLGNVSISGNNSVTLQPGTYYGGITISDVGDTSS